MDREDKQYMAGLVSGLATQITGVEDKLGKKITGIEDSLQEQIRHNGILIERVESNVSLIQEGFSDFSKDMSQVKKDIAHIKETIQDYPILRQTVKKHSRQLAELQK